MLEALDAQQVAGHGIRARVGERAITAGRAEMFTCNNGEGETLAQAVEKLTAQSKSIVVIAIDERVVGVIGLADQPRRNARETIARLHRMGIKRAIMLTGDRDTVASAMAKEMGVDEYHAELLPGQKLELVKKLEAKYGKLAMVGDGVNDAPALASATCGIAMGGAGSDVAIETADIVLMADDLAKLPEAIGLSRFSRRIIAQNLFIALGVISVLAPLSALGFTYLGVAVLFHEGSTVVVVLNAMRLLLYKPR
jgi:Cd2+/Zn2+-exporting ATPase